MKPILTMGFMLFAALGCAPTPTIRPVPSDAARVETVQTISPVPFEAAQAETVEKEGLRISTDRTAQKIKVQSPDLELILPYAADWTVGSSTVTPTSRNVLTGTSRHIKMMVTVHEVPRSEGSADEYLSRTLQNMSEALKKRGASLKERVISQGRDKIFVFEISSKTFFNVARKTPSGRILHLTVSTVMGASRDEAAAVEKSVVEILAPSFVALR